MKRLRLFIAGFVMCLVGIFAAAAFGQKSIAPVDFAKKIAEATPAELPQSPAGMRSGTDARDEGLKGKVKSVIKYSLEAGKKSVAKESYYGDDGNLVRSVEYMDGFPYSVIVWGYIDGMRVLRSGDVMYAAGEKPIAGGMSFTTRAEDNAKYPNAARDPRYRMRYVYKYDSQQRLTEKSGFQNNGELWLHWTYTYEGNLRIERQFGADGSQWSKTGYVLDPNGNVEGRHLYDSKDRVAESEIIRNEVDTNGNWIVQKTFEEKKLKGRSTLKLRWTTYRTVTYYP